MLHGKNSPLRFGGGVLRGDRPAHKGTIANVEKLPLQSRAANALVSLVAYLAKFFCPTNLAVFYPHPQASLGPGEVVGACALLATVTGIAVLWRRKYPYLIVGWLWYLGMLMPVIGLMQVGSQAMADRYTYLPQIGLAIMLAWPLARLASLRPVGRVAVPVASACAIVVLMACAWWQTGFCATAKPFGGMPDCTTGNAIAYNNLGALLGEAGKIDEARDNFVAALKFDPQYLRAQVNLAKTMTRQGKPDAAVDMFSADSGETSR